jgi:hypothetical protein
MWLSLNGVVAQVHSSCSRTKFGFRYAVDYFGKWDTRAVSIKSPKNLIA